MSCNDPYMICSGCGGSGAGAAGGAAAFLGEVDLRGEAAGVARA